MVMRGIGEDLMRVNLVQEYALSGDEGDEEAGAWDIEVMYENMEGLDMDSETDDEINELLKELHEYIQNPDPDDEYVEYDDETMELLKNFGILMDEDVTEDAEDDGNKTEDDNMVIDEGGKNGGNNYFEKDRQKWADIEDPSQNDEYVELRNLGTQMNADVGNKMGNGSKKTQDGTMTNNQDGKNYSCGQKSWEQHRKHRGRQKDQRRFPMTRRKAKRAKAH